MVFALWYTHYSIVYVKFQVYMLIDVIGWKSWKLLGQGEEQNMLEMFLRRHQEILG